ncbi:unnamed protein product [Lymnaea stagnalis]|uniref:BTB domain-containing protein n=1 Tax=Lymnaea stagnalis TaxID=6523 RepID=A0AAV2HJ27_LYMST
MVKSSLACSLQACLGQLWTKDDYSDFTVVVDGQEFQCHKFILKACSTYFVGLLRSDMIETNQQRDVLTNMSKETFSVILNAIYKGEDGLTVDNVIQVWHATHYLDIPYLVEECENFVMENMTLLNYEDFYSNANLLNSKIVVEFVKKFMLNNFEHFQKSKTFLNLSFHDVYMTLNDHYLKVTSEDSVIEAILLWITHNERSLDASKNDVEKFEVTPNLTVLCDQVDKIGVFKENGTENNDKIILTEEEEQGVALNDVSQNPEIEQDQIDQKLKSHLKDTSQTDHILTKLFKAARLCLASRDCLEKLVRNPMVASDPDALNMVLESLLYHWRADCYSINNVVRYRENDTFTFVMVYVDKDEVKGYSIQTHRFHSIVTYQKHQYGNPKAIAAVNGDVYTVSPIIKEEQRANSTYMTRVGYLYFQMLNKNSRNWETLGESTNSFDGALLTTQAGVFYCSTRCDNVEFEKNIFHSLGFLKNTVSNIRGGTTFEGDFFIFYASVRSIGVQRYNKRTETKTELNKISGPSENFTSFQHDRNLFVLLKDGSLWMLFGSGSKSSEFTFLEKLWEGEMTLKGAICNDEQLIVFCDERQPRSSGVSEENKKALLEKSLPGVFNGIKCVNVESDTDVVPMIIAKNRLSKI